MMDNWLEILILVIGFMLSGLIASHFKKKRENEKQADAAKPETNPEKNGEPPPAGGKDRE
jgi:hypothetical protein